MAGKRAMRPREEWGGGCLHSFALLRMQMKRVVDRLLIRATNFSLHYQNTLKQTGDENKECHQVFD